MRTTSPSDGPEPGSERPKALFICGSLNQTRHDAPDRARRCPSVRRASPPTTATAYLERLRRAGLLDFTILGWPWRAQSIRYLRQHGLPMDHEGRRNDYDLVVTCSDVIVPRNILDKRVVVVQEGMTDPERFWFWARKILLVVPRWAAGTAWTGASNLYDRFCVASQGYRDLFVRKGADPGKIVVTGIPNFDNCARYRDNDFPHRDYVLCCTSDTRETYKLDNRKKFIRRAAGDRGRAGRCSSSCTPTRTASAAPARSSAGRPGRGCSPAARPRRWWPTPSVLICQYSTLAFVGLALGKEVHSYFDLEELRRLLPLQGGGAAGNIAEVCRGCCATSARPRRGGRVPGCSASGCQRRPRRGRVVRIVAVVQARMGSSRLPGKVRHAGGGRHPARADARAGARGPLARRGGGGHHPPPRRRRHRRDLPAAAGPGVRRPPDRPARPPPARRAGDRGGGGGEDPLGLPAHRPAHHRPGGGLLPGERRPLRLRQQPAPGHLPRRQRRRGVAPGGARAGRPRGAQAARARAHDPVRLGPARALPHRQRRLGDAGWTTR